MECYDAYILLVICSLFLITPAFLRLSISIHNSNCIRCQTTYRGVYSAILCSRQCLCMYIIWDHG